MKKRKQAMEKVKGGKPHDTTKRSLPHNVRHAMNPSSGKDQKGYFEERDSKGKLISYGIRH